MRWPLHNLARLVVHLLEAGATFAPTWTTLDAAHKRAGLAGKLKTARGEFAAKRASATRLPDSVGATVRARFTRQLARLEADVERLAAHMAVFNPA